VIEYPIIAKITEPRFAKLRERATSPPSTRPRPLGDAVIVSLNTQNESPGDYSSQVRRTTQAPAQQQGLRPPIESLKKRIRDAELPDEEKDRLDTLLRAADLIVDRDVEEFAFRVDQMVTLREALHRATQVIAREQMRSANIALFHPVQNESTQAGAQDTDAGPPAPPADTRE